jgi:hypothetical protein
LPCHHVYVFVIPEINPPTSMPLPSTPTPRREWLPWRCAQLRYWVTVPSYHARLASVYSSALASLDLERYSPQVTTSTIKLSKLSSKVTMQSQPAPVIKIQPSSSVAHSGWDRPFGSPGLFSSPKLTDVCRESSMSTWE